LNSPFLGKDPDPLSPITLGFLGPVTTLFNYAGGQQIHNPTKKIRKHPSNRLENIPEARRL
jgi:hypothetical protein